MQIGKELKIILKRVRRRYRDRRVESQRRWSKALFKRLATFTLSDFVPLEIRPLQNAVFCNILFILCEGYLNQIESKKDFSIRP